MTRLSPDENCSRCGSVLFPPELAVRIFFAVFPPTADYVCVTCGRAYKWDGTARTLNVLAAIATEADDAA
jgi:DNA-directed RNA polymerase subunit RPC12/RpoP